MMISIPRINQPVHPALICWTKESWQLAKPREIKSCPIWLSCSSSLSMLPVKNMFLQSDIQPGTWSFYSLKQHWSQHGQASGFQSSFIRHSNCDFRERNMTAVFLTLSDSLSAARWEESASPNRFISINHTEYCIMQVCSLLSQWITPFFLSCLNQPHGLCVL